MSAFPVTARSATALAGLFLLSLVAIGCDATGGAATRPSQRRADFTVSPERPIKIVCTTGMVAELARHVGGPLVDVRSLMGEGVDPHLYKPSTSDVVKLSDADIVFYSGLHLEGKMADIFDRMAERRNVVAVTDAIPRSRLLEVAPGTWDPHVWFDVALWSEASKSVQAALEHFDPPHAAEYRTCGESYRAELAKLDAECRQRLTRIPAARRVLVTAHDAFHYFGRAYDVEVRAIQGVSTESEAGVREINQLVEFIVERGVKAVFVETSVSNRNIEALVEGCHARNHEVRIGGELFSDAMGRAGTPDGTYIGMVRHNVGTILHGLE